MIYIKNNDVFDVIRPIFDINRPIFDINRIRIRNLNSNCHNNFDGFQQRYNTQKRQLKPIRLQFKANLNWRSIRSH